MSNNDRSNAERLEAAFAKVNKTNPVEDQTDGNSNQTNAGHSPRKARPHSALIKEAIRQEPLSETGQYVVDHYTAVLTEIHVPKKPDLISQKELSAMVSGHYLLANQLDIVKTSDGAKVKVDAFNLLLAHDKKAIDTTYVPGGDELIYDEFINAKGQMVLNRFPKLNEWRDPLTVLESADSPQTRATSKEIADFKALIDYYWPGKQTAILDFLAFALRSPDEELQWLWCNIAPPDLPDMLPVVLAPVLLLLSKVDQTDTIKWAIFDPNYDGVLARKRLVIFTDLIPADETKRSGNPKTLLPTYVRWLPNSLKQKTFNPKFKTTIQEECACLFTASTHDPESLLLNQTDSRTFWITQQRHEAPWDVDQANDLATRHQQTYNDAALCLRLAYWLAYEYGMTKDFAKHHAPAANDITLLVSGSLNDLQLALIDVLEQWSDDKEFPVYGVPHKALIEDIEKLCRNGAAPFDLVDTVKKPVELAKLLHNTPWSITRRIKGGADERVKLHGSTREHMVYRTDRGIDAAADSYRAYRDR
jgi:hypothetical protein